MREIESIVGIQWEQDIPTTRGNHKIGNVQNMKLVQFCRGFIFCSFPVEVYLIIHIEQNKSFSKNFKNKVSE